MEKWHAAKPKSIANGAPVAAKPAAPTAGAADAAAVHEVFGEAMVDEVRRDRRVVGITAAMNSGTGLNILQKAEPDHYFDVGIAEQQAVLFAAGLALEGVKPVAAIYSTFLQRAFDQIVHDVCLQNLNVVFAMDRAGLVGDDGPTHHGVFDIAYLRCLPNMTLMAPRDEAMLVAHAAHGAAYDRRAGRAALPARRGRRRRRCPTEPQPIEIGTGEILREGERVALLGYGTRRRRRRSRRRTCSPSTGSTSTVADARFAKPLDARAAGPARAPSTSCSSPSRRACSPGGFGSAVWEHLNDAGLRRRGSCASACPTATSRTASPRCCTPRSASRASAIARARMRRARRRRRGRRRGVTRGPPADPGADRRRERARSGDGTPPSLEAQRRATCRRRSSSAARSSSSRTSRTS